MDCYRGSTFLSFVPFIATASKYPFFIYHFVVFEVTVKASHAFLPQASSSLPSLTAGQFSEGGCVRSLMPTTHEDNGPLDLWPCCGKKVYWEPLLPLSQSQGTLCDSRQGRGELLHLHTNLFVTYCPLHSHPSSTSTAHPEKMALFPCLLTPFSSCRPSKHLAHFKYSSITCFTILPDVGIVHYYTLC